MFAMDVSRQCALHRMRKGGGEEEGIAKSVVPFAEGQWKESLVTSDGSPAEVCRVYSVHTKSE